MVDYLFLKYDTAFQQIIALKNCVGIYKSFPYNIY